MPDENTKAVIAYGLGVLSNATGNLLSDAAKRAVPALWRGASAAVHEAVQRALPQAREQFERNAGSFVAALADEVTRGADEGEAAGIADAAARKFEEPDVAVAVADALRTAGRTSSAERHRALAKLVVARLATDTESASAVTANAALRAMESLGGPHLRTLGLLALVHYAGRPNSASAAYARFPTQPPALDYGAYAAADLAAFNQAQRDWNSSYMAWLQALEPHTCAYADDLMARLRRNLERVGVPDGVPESLIIHLVATGCAIWHNSDPDFYDALARPIAPPFPPDSSVADRAREDAVARAYGATLFGARGEDAALGRLAALWGATLHRVAFTPAGFLIGLAALDVLSDEQTSQEWRWAGVADHALVLSPYTPAPTFSEAWANDHRFQETVDKALERRARLQGRSYR